MSPTDQNIIIPRRFFIVCVPASAMRRRLHLFGIQEHHVSSFVAAVAFCTPLSLLQITASHLRAVTVNTLRCASLFELAACGSFPPSCVFASPPLPSN